MLSGLKLISAATAKAKALSAIWTFPSIIFPALVIGWAAEATQFLLPQGLASAILAWLRTLPESAVEEVIAGKQAPMGLMNMVSSNINQWTVLVAMIPIVYSFSRGQVSVVHFDDHQKLEIFLTMAQSILGFLFLANMEFRWYEASGLFSLWFIQFVFPEWREEITFVYLLWILIELLRAFAGEKKLKAFKQFNILFKTYVLKKT